ncbi:MAG TPA: LPS-assembly protein LptD, partial [Firmicutes bacterium]|nr:LPS-assembly protein LptD [Bacillota bacterium]
MGKTRLWRLAAAVLALAAFPARAAGSGDVVRLQAGQGLRYEAEGQVLVAEGGARLAYRNITLEADSLRVELEYDLVRAEGHVRYRKGDERVEAASAVFDLKRERGTFLDVTTAAFRPEDVRGEVAVSGEFLESGQSLLRLSKSSVTTCDLAEPHYHLEAREVTIYLDDHLVAREVSYYEGRLRLFTLPFLIVSLKKDNRFELPRVGYAEEDGWFVKTTYNYRRSPSAYGKYFLDWYERKGLGLGLKHDYAFGAQPRDGSGWAYLYVKGYRPRQDEEVFAGLNHRQRFGPAWTGSLQGTYEDRYLSSDQTQETASAALQLSQQAQGALTDLRAAWRGQATTALPGPGGEASTSVDLRDFRLSINSAQKLAKEWDWRFGASASRYFRVGEQPYDNLGYQTQLVRAFPAFTLRLSAQQQFNPPRVAEGETPPPWNSYSRLPEVALETRTLTYRGRPLPLAFTGSFSRYAERSVYHPEGYTLTMGNLTGRVTGLSQPLTRTLTATWSGSGTATCYQNGDYTLGATSGAGLAYRPLPGLTASLRHQWQDRLGVNPFVSTGINPAESLSGSLNYAAGGLSLDLSGGYDLLARYYQEAAGRFTLTRPAQTVTGLVTFDPNAGTWKRA